MLLALIVGTDRSEATAPTLPANSISYGYDDGGRLTTAIDPNASSNGVATYSYDAAGNITQIGRQSSAGVSVVQVAPAKAAPGATVIVYGTGFSATASSDSVSFGGAAATPTFATTTQLTVTVPGAAASGPVSVTAPGGNASGGSFTVLSAPQAPTITSASATTVDQGAQLTVTGTKFSAQAADNNVAIGGIRAKVTAATTTTLTVTLAPGAMSGAISVATPAGIGTSSFDVFVAPRGSSATNVQATGRMALGDTNHVVSLPTTGKLGLIVFDGVAGQKAFLNIPASTVAISSLTIFDPFGLSLTTGSVGSSGGSIDTIKLPTTGTYTIEINPVSGSGSVTLSLLNAASITGTIQANGQANPINGFTAGVNAYETFAGTANQRVFLKIDSQLSSVIVRLRDPNGFLVASTSLGATTGYIDTQTLSSAGTYTIEVDPTGATTGSATLTLYNVPADISGTITPGVGGATPTSFTIGTPGQGAAYTFSGTLNQRISIQLRAPTSGAAIPSGYVRLLKPDGTELTNSGIFSNSVAYIDTLQLPVAGTYTVVVDPYGLSIGGGRLNVYAVPADISGTVTPGGTGQTPKAPTFATPGQNAAYTFSGTVGQRISLEVLPPTSGTTLSIGTLALVKPDGSTQASTLFTLPLSTSYGFVDTQTLSVAGTYKVVVDPYQEKTGSLRLFTYSVPADISGTIVIGGAAKTPTTTVPGQNAAYTFSGNANQIVKLALSTSTFTQATARILNPDLSTLTSQTFGTTNTSFNATLPTTGTYTIQIDPSAIYIGHVTLTLTQVAAAGINPGATKPATDATIDAARLPKAPKPPLTPLPHYKPSLTERWYPPSKDPSTWFSNRPQSPFELLPPREAAPGVTAVAGRVLRLDGLPLARVTLSADGHKTITDRSGRFLLRGLRPGHVVLTVNATTADRTGARYGLYEIGVDVTASKTKMLPFTIWSPLLDTKHEVKLHYPLRHAVTLTTPLIPGLEVHIPAGSQIHDRVGHLINHIGITPIPLDRSPFPMPGNFPVYFTIQPGGTYVWPHGVSIVYPNKFHANPGQRVQFSSYDPNDQGWHVYGEGTVTPNGKQITFDPGTRQYELTSSGISLGCVPCILGGLIAGLIKGDPVDVPTGAFTFPHTDLVEPGTPQIDVTRSYQSNDTVTRTFGVGDGTSYGMFLYQPSIHDYSSADLVFANGTRVHYARISPGTDYAEAILENDTTPGPFCKSRVTWNGTGWDLTLKDGTVYTFGNGAPLQAVRDRFGNQVTVLHGTSTYGDISDVVSSSGRWLHFTYGGGAGLATQVDDQSGRSVHYQYDGGGHLMKFTDVVGDDTNFGYDASNRMTTIQDPRLYTFITNHYDSNGRVDVQTLGDNGAYHYAYTTDGNNNVTATDITNPRGYIEHLTFNSAGLPLTDTRAQGTSNAQTTTYTYQASTDLLLYAVDPLNRETDFTYDPMGNVLSTTRLAGTPNAVTTNYTYDPLYNQLTSVTDPLTHKTQYGYDARGALASVTNALQKSTTITNNAAGLPTSEKDALQNQTQFTYYLGDRVTVTDANGGTARIFRDSRGAPTHMIDPLGRDSVSSYDAAGDVLSTTDALGDTTNYQYDKDGDLTQVTDARQHATGFTYDPMDRVASMTDPLQHTISFIYDPNGNVSTATDRRGLVASYQYDELDRRTFAGYDTTGTPPNQQYASTTNFNYDSGNRLHQITDSQAGQITLGYDGLDELTSEANPEGSVGYTYDAAGRRQTMTVSGQAQTSYGYDNADRFTSITRGTLSGGVTYDDAGRPTVITLPDGITETYTDDGDGNVTGITYAQGATTLGAIIYGYDAASRRIGEGGSFARTGLPQAMASATYDAANRISTWGGQAFAWDNNGNLTSDGANNYTWNARGQLSAIGGATTAAFSYDGLGRRESTTLGGATTRFLYDGASVAQEQNATGSVLRDYLAAPFGGQLFGVTASGATQSYLGDALGSTLALADGSGLIQAQYTYEPYGASTKTGSSSTAYQYTGRENDGTGLQYNRARYYDATLGRFISEDPLSFAGGDVNLYAYAQDDPVNLTDPLGLTVEGAIEDGAASSTEAAAAAAGCAAGAGAGYLGGLGIKYLINHGIPGFGNGATGGGSAGGSTGGTASAASGGGGDCPPGDVVCQILKEIEANGKQFKTQDNFDMPGGQSGARAMFDRLTTGSNVRSMGNGRWIATLKDGTIVTLRSPATSSTGDWTVNINTGGRYVTAKFP